MNFLDITVMKNGSQLVTDLYVKPTGTHKYLHASSCHVSSNSSNASASSKVKFCVSF